MIEGGGGGGANVHLYTKELAILIPMHASLFLGKPIDVRYCFVCLPCYKMFCQEQKKESFKGNKR